jgi:transcriptional regulator with XRE-family HTH domain
MSGCNPLDLQGFVTSLDQRRRVEGLSWREVGRQAGVSPSTLTRLQQGRHPDVATFGALVQWLGASPQDFFEAGPAIVDVSPPAAVLAALLRSKDVQSLSPDSRLALDAIVQAAIRILRDSKQA